MADTTQATDAISVKKQSLQRFLAVVVFVSIAIPAVISGGVLIHENYQRTIAQDSLAAVHNYADLLEAGMSVALWNVSPELGQPLMDSVLVDPSVLAVVVTTEQQQTFLEHRSPNISAQAEDSITIKREVSYNNAKLGDVEVVYSLAKAQSRAANETRLLAIIIFVQLVVSLATISYVLHRRVLAPLKSLGSAAAGIAQGDLKTAIPCVKNDEFGALSRELETMRGVLEENFTQLEQRVDERTAQLRAVNYTMKATLDQLQHTQQNLIQSEKLAALGALVAGIAHELNTPIGNGLTVATTLCDSCNGIKREMQGGLTRSALEKFVRDMDEGSQLVNRNLEKASELVSSFKQVAVDRTSAQRRKFSLRDMLHETRLTVSPLFKRTPFIVDIDVVEDVILDGYPGPLGQVITNLLSNAVIHAFEGRAHGHVVLATQKMADGVRLTVADDGVGIPNDNQARIFDPFFTTKLGAGGNGLGMHIVHNIVTGVLGGTIEVASQIGEGTCFTLFVPYVAPRVPADDDGSETPEWRRINSA